MHLHMHKNVLCIYTCIKLEMLSILQYTTYKQGGKRMFLSFSYKPYIVIIGDIINSKELEHRNEVQERLRRTLQDINERYNADIAASFMITLGDEFQGLLHNGKNTMKIIEELRSSMYPVRIRFGIGIGEVFTKIDQVETREIDGPCYYSARSAIDYLKKSEKRYHSDEADTRIEIEEDASDCASLMNTVFSLMSVIERNWTERQRAIIYDYALHQDGQEKCAARLEIAQSSVQRGLTNGNYYAYAQALNTINHILGEIQKNDI